MPFSSSVCSCCSLLQSEEHLAVKTNNQKGHSYIWHIHTQACTHSHAHIGEGSQGASWPLKCLKLSGCCFKHNKFLLYLCLHVLVWKRLSFLRRRAGKLILFFIFLMMAVYREIGSQRQIKDRQSFPLEENSTISGRKSLQKEKKVCANHDTHCLYQQAARNQTFVP